ncbi:MAG TPA: hypothetical protein VF363_08995 [Candidatus Eisenbacteria bacterium]
MARDRAELRQDRNELRGDRRDVRQDRADVARLSRLLARLDDAKASGNRREEARVRVRLRQFLRGEVVEAHRDVVKDRAETRQSDDRRDLRDDARDSAKSRARLDRELAIVRELRSIQPAVRSGDRRASRREDRLLGDFLQLVKQDARESGREWREDRAERRDDRREIHEDRQGGPQGGGDYH